MAQEPSLQSTQITPPGGTGKLETFLSFFILIFLMSFSRLSFFWFLFFRILIDSPTISSFRFLFSDCLSSSLFSKSISLTVTNEEKLSRCTKLAFCGKHFRIFERSRVSVKVCFEIKWSDGIHGVAVMERTLISNLYNSRNIFEY